MWSKKKINKWCQNFIIKNKRIPNLKDLNSKNNPDIKTITIFFSSLEELIDNCGPLSFNKRKDKQNTFGNLKNGFLSFYNEFDRYPSAIEIDNYKNLPTSRTIQRSWGGLETLRQAMNLEITNYTKGEIRSKKSAQIGLRGLDEENKLELILQEYFGEIFVHSQKRINQVRADFFIFTPNGNFAIDIFYFENKNSFNSDLNLKLKTYKDYPYPVIYLPVNPLFASETINNWVKNKIIPIPTTQKVLPYQDFLNWIKTIKPYPKTLVINSKKRIFTL